MASTGTAFFPGSSSFPNTTQYGGQGLRPYARCRISYDDVSVANPVWNEVLNSDLRAFSVSRGRDSELSEFDAGSATVTIDNRDRAYDPNSNASIRPLNRVWLYEEFSGEVHDLIKGYVTSWDLAWPGGGWSDATATANVSDEFAVLAATGLPATDPVRESYSALIAIDLPEAYYDLNEFSGDRVKTDTGDNVVHDFQQEPVDPPQVRRSDRKLVRAAYRGPRKRF